MLKSVRIAVLVLLLLSAAAAALADDLYPPVWRGQPNTTTQEWKFATSSPVTTPEPGFVNPYGVPHAHAYPGTGQNWVDLWGGRQGMWPLSGTIEVEIPNRPLPNPQKLIWVQLTWAKQVDSSAPVVWELNSGIQGTRVKNDLVLGPTGYPYPNDLWYHSVFQIVLPFNPTWEMVKIDGTLVVDQLVIDTWCIPEPSSLLALGTGLFGLAGLAVRRRK